VKVGTVRVFVAGGTGVIGRAVVRALVKDGHEVVATARSKEKADLVRSLGAEPVFVDILNRDGLEFAMAKCPWVFNLTSVIPRSMSSAPADWAQNDRVRTQGTEILVYAARTVRAELYVHTSVALVHGDGGADLVDEETPPSPGPLLQSAFDGETHVQKAAIDGLNVLVLRPATIYSPEAWHTKWVVDAVRSGRMRVPGTGKNFISSIHVDDLAAAYLAAARHGKPGESFLLSDDEPLTLRDYADAWAEAAGAPPPRSVSPFLARLALGRTTLEAVQMSLRLSNRRAREKLGWTPKYRSVREGAKAVVTQMDGMRRE